MEIVEILQLHALRFCLHSLPCRTLLNSKFRGLLRPTISRPVCCGIKHPSRTYDQFFITYYCQTVASLLIRGAVSDNCCCASPVVILGSESRRTGDRILLSQIRDFPFRRLLRLAWSRWRYYLLLISYRHGPYRKQSYSIVASNCCFIKNLLPSNGNVFTVSLARNCRCLQRHRLATGPPAAEIALLSHKINFLYLHCSY
jgi:hypothetical protein